MSEPDLIIRPIQEADIEKISSVCWQGRDAQARLMEKQGTLGMGAWEGGICVGLLHCYRVELPDWDDADFPDYGRKRPLSWPLGWPLLAAREKGLRFGGPAWGHACFHVGFTGSGARRADRAYFGRGIGTALCGASVQWARDHGYPAVLAHGGSKVVPEYNVMMGCLPWTTYARLGFECLAMEEDGRRAPWWATDDAAPNVVKQAREAVESGAAPEALCARLMVLRL